jgi:anti-sigma factor RsiW
MNTGITHPTEEQLCSCAIGDCSEATRRHLETCSDCREYVDSIKSISDDIAGLGDESVPEHLDEAVLDIIGRERRKKRHQAFMFGSINPLTLGLLAMLVCLLFGTAVIFLAK